MGYPHRRKNRRTHALKRGKEKAGDLIAPDCAIFALVLLPPSPLGRGPFSSRGAFLSRLNGTSPFTYLRINESSFSFKCLTNNLVQICQDYFTVGGVPVRLPNESRR